MSKRPFSLQRRLATGLALSLLVTLPAAGLLLAQSLRQVVEGYVLERLDHDLESLVADLVVAPGSAPRLDPQHLTPVYHQPYSGHYYQLRQEAGEPVRSRSLWDSALDLPAVPPGQRVVLRAPGPVGQRLLVLVRGVEKQGRAVTLAVAEDLGPLQTALQRTQILLVAVAAAVLAALLLVQYLLLRHGLRPLARLRGQLRALARGEQGALVAADAPAEVRPLVEQINRLLEAQSLRLERSRKALGNLAHALKTPLTLLSRLGDEPALAEQPRLRAALSERVEQMRATVDRELRRARLAGSAAAGRQVELEQVLPGLLKTLRALYRERDLALETRLEPGLRFAGDREDLLELLGVLLDNACRHARGQVLLRSWRAEGALHLVVDDDGPGVPPGKREALLQRGRRLDEDQPGSGLGLAIAADIVDQYQGRLSLDQAPLGGLRVALSFPEPAALAAAGLRSG